MSVTELLVKLSVDWTILLISVYVEFTVAHLCLIDVKAVQMEAFGMAVAEVRVLCGQP